MDSHHHAHLPTIHTLAGLAAAGAHHQETKQHPMGQFQHRAATMQQQQQPLVNTSSQNHQLLHFHHSPAQQQHANAPTSAQQNSYSTLSHLNLGQAPGAHLNLISHLSGAPNNSNGLFNSSTLHHPTSSQNSASSQATSLASSSNSAHHLQHYFNTAHPHHLQQQQQQHQLHLQQQQQQQQQQLLMNGTAHLGHQTGPVQHAQSAAYNMNSSDYSSSTYHVYDQILGDQIIDDLIVIKQERMKQKREQEQKIKVILFGLAVILLVGLLMFLLVKLFDVTNHAGGSVTAGDRNSLQTSSLLRIDASGATGNQNNNNNNNNNEQHQPFAPSFVYNKRPHWAPPMGGQTKPPAWEFDPNQMDAPPPGPPQLDQVQHQQQLQQQQAPTNRYLPFVPPVMPIVPPTNFQRPVHAQPGAPQQPVVLPREQSGATAAQPQLQAAQQPDRQQAQAQPQPHHHNHLLPNFLQQQQQPGQQTFKRPPVHAPEAPALIPTQSDISNNHNNNNLRGCRGRHCPAAGCPNNCSNRGECVRHSQAAAAATAAANPGAGPSGQSSSSAAQAAGDAPWLLQQQAEWRCQCAPGSTGADCSIPIERQCDDGLDNDQDGLVDCADSECCADPVCQNSTLCMKSPDPLDILMRKQPPPPTSSFFQRMQFLIEKMSSQFYSNPRDFNDSILTSASKYFDRASVLRGRVVYQKQGVLGVRVSVAGQRNLGIALTRDGGYFDLMVNGGGAVTVEFLREPFVTLHKTIRVPWNEIVLVDPIELQVAGRAEGELQASAESELAAPTCSAHNYRLLRPQIMAAPNSIRRSRAGLSSSASSAPISSHQNRAVILRDSAMVQQSIVLPQSQQAGATRNESLALVYISSRASEFMSTINIQLTPGPKQLALVRDSQESASASASASAAQNSNTNSPANGAPSSHQEDFKLSDELKQIHLKIVIEGILFEQTFEPQPNLSFTYAWNRRNVYRQKSFGLSTASVSVGYEYFDCKQIIWTAKQLQLPGHELGISDMGDSWNLNVHHRYNYREAILQRGDGQNFNLKTERARIVAPLLGDGYARPQVCPYCEGAASAPGDQKLLRPLALVSAPDGALYVGDHNMIRRLEPAAASLATSGAAAERAVRTVLELPPGRVPAKGYSLALSLASAPGQETGARLCMTDTDRHQVFWVREQRAPAGNSNSAASGYDPTTSNETTPPSGSAALASAAASWEEALVPLVGNGQRCSAEDALSCGDQRLALEARLIEPKAMAFDLAGRMYLADGPNVRLVDVDQKIYTLLGDYSPARRHTKFPCASGETVPMHKFVPKWPLDVALNPLDETLHVLDDNIVYRVTQDKRVQVVAGRPAHCGANSAGGAVAGALAQRATEVALQGARFIAFNQNGHLFISEDEPGRQAARVLVVEDDTISVYAGASGESEAAAAAAAVDSATPSNSGISSSSSNINNNNNNNRRLSNALLPPGAGPAARALEHRFQSIAAIALDQRGHLLVADWAQLRVLSVEPDVPQMTAAGEYEIQSPESPDELLVFNRHGHHVATRELGAGAAAATTSTNTGQQLARAALSNKYTFSYTVSTSFGQLASVSLANGDKLSILRDGHQHSVRAIETSYGLQCKLDVARNGQVHSVALQTSAGAPAKIVFSYHPGGGLLKQSRDQATGDTFDFLYDEFGRAAAVLHSSPQLAQPLECRPQQQQLATQSQAIANPFLAQHCAALIVAE